MLTSSMQKRIIVLVAVGMTAVLALLGILSSMTVDQSIKRTLQERLSLAESGADHIDYVLKENIDLLQSAAMSGSLQDQGVVPEAVRAALRNTYFHSVFSDGVYIVDSNGKMIWREPSFSTRPLDVSTYSHVKAALETGRPEVSNTYQVPGTGQLVVSIVIPMRNSQGEIVGLIGGDIDLTSSSLQEIIKPVGLGPSGYVQLIDANGTVIAASRPADVLTESDHGNHLADLIRDKRSGVSTCHGCHENPQPMGSQTVREAEVMAFVPLDSAPWGLAIREPEREALAPAHNLQRQFIVIGIPLLAIAVVLAWATAQSVIRPIQSLTKSAEQIANGNLCNQTPYLGEDEIGKLANAFDVMRVKLKESIDSFQKLNKELEIRVERRTAELRDSEQQLVQRNHELSVANEEISHKEQLRGELLQRCLTAQEEERKRIARELHDETSQTLAALVVSLDATNVAPFRNEADSRRRMDSIKQVAVRALDDIHKIIYDLRPSLLDDLGLIAAINWYAESRLKPAGTRFSLEVSGDERRLEPQIETALFRVVQEAITNIAKHAQAGNAAISLDFKHSSIGVQIEDDGRGFDLHQGLEAGEVSSHFGLLGMRERVQLLGGELQVSSEPDGGTAIKVKLPVIERGGQSVEDKSIASR